MPSISAENDPLPRVSIGRFMAAVAGAAVVAGLGGYLTGLAIKQWATAGSMALLLVGLAGGWVGAALAGTPSRPLAILYALSCILAFVLAEICWIRWATTTGDEGWFASAQAFPTFLVEYQVSALIAGAIALVAANVAYQRIA